MTQKPHKPPRYGNPERFGPVLSHTTHFPHPGNWEKFIPPEIEDALDKVGSDETYVDAARTIHRWAEGYRVAAETAADQATDLKRQIDPKAEAVEPNYILAGFAFALCYMVERCAMLDRKCTEAGGFKSTGGSATREDPRYRLPHKVNTRGSLD